MKSLPDSKGVVTHYFRPPYLHVGNTREKADSLTKFLERIGYRMAPVTFDNEDYIFAAAYGKSMETGNTSQAAQIGKDYLTYQQNKIRYFES
ncbi:MAG: hypothetical protein LWW85_13540, partial [Marinilabiliales bacterium]|nr:hypothetical protein [Marinilabiliales bacterium]